ncbi:DUF2972 domain-containing protein, partial [Campylobacter sp.]|uniref:DUF2972 domain-containing protein n=1 Tax=Campylobacter sp. TaxID=205 RepID=UPI0026DCE07A
SRVRTFFKLLRIFLAHKNNQKFYKKFTTFFPQLHYPALEKCQDYGEALWIRASLPYLLGENFIRALKKRRFSRIYEEAQGYEALFAQISKAHPSSGELELILEQKEAFASFFIPAQSPLKEVILANLSFVCEHFFEVKIWLTSPYFCEKYSTHPHPPLLDVRILNALLKDGADLQNETDAAQFETQKASYLARNLTYQTIPAALAWRLNLPLPSTFKFFFAYMYGAGNFSFHLYMDALKMRALHSGWGEDEGFYAKSYEELLGGDDCFVSLLAWDYFHCPKTWALLDADKDMLILVRDPILCLRHLLNHSYGISRKKDLFDWREDFEEIFMPLNYRLAYFKGGKHCFRVSKKPNLCNLYAPWLKEYVDRPLIRSIQKKIGARTVRFMDTGEILPGRVLSTLTELSKRYHFQSPDLAQSSFFEARHAQKSFSKLLGFQIGLPGGLLVFVDNSRERRYLDADYVGLNVEFLGADDANFKLCMRKEHYERLRNGGLYDEARAYFQRLYAHYLARWEWEEKRCISAQDILRLFRRDKKLYHHYKKIFDEELEGLKKS